MISMSWIYLPGIFILSAFVKSSSATEDAQLFAIVVDPPDGENGRVTPVYESTTDQHKWQWYYRPSLVDTNGT